MPVAWLIRGLTPIREAVISRLAHIGVDVIDVDSAPNLPDPGHTVAIAFCDDEATWAILEGATGMQGRLAVLSTIEPAMYRRALSQGIGAVHVDTSSEIIVDAALAAARQEALIPMAVATHLVAPGQPLDPAQHLLDPIERDLLRALTRGETIVSLSSRYHYSERTLRRRMQAVYLKLGVAGRADAIRAADRLGLLAD